MSIVNEEDNSRTRQIYESTKQGKLLRSTKLENQAQVLEDKAWDEKSDGSEESAYDSKAAKEERIR